MRDAKRVLYLTRSASLARFFVHIHTPLYREAYALILNSLITSGLGVVYWILAARHYTADAVGFNAAIISVMLFLSGLAQLNFRSVMIRFVPRAGYATRRLIASGYVLQSIVALVGSIVFISGIRLWAPALSFLSSNPLLMLWFVLSTINWGIFVLQDAVLTGLRQAVWVLIENAIFSLVKLALLLLFATSYPGHGILASWTVAVALSIPPINFLIIGRLISRHVQATAKQAVPLLSAEVARYIAGDYVGSLFLLASTTLVPIIVTNVAGSRANAYFYPPWLIFSSLQLVAANMATSYTVEAVQDQNSVQRHSLPVLLHTARLLAPIIVVVVITAPYILRLFGPDYGREGAALLRLLALSAIPNVVPVFFISVARVQRLTGRVTLVQALLFALQISLCFVFLPRYGILGVGIAWLIGQSTVALILMLHQWRAILLNNKL